MDHRKSAGRRSAPQAAVQRVPEFRDVFNRVLTVSIHLYRMAKPASAAACKPRITAAPLPAFLPGELRSRQAVRQPDYPVAVRGGIAAVIHHNTGQIKWLKRASTPGIIAPWL